MYVHAIRHSNSASLSDCDFLVCVIFFIYVTDRLGLHNLGQSDRKGEGRALPDGTLEPEFLAMLLYDLFGYVQTEPGAADAGGLCVKRAEEARKEPCLILLCYAGAEVLHGYDTFALCLRDPHDHRIRERRVLDRIGEHIQEYLRDTDLVCHHLYLGATVIFDLVRRR